MSEFTEKLILKIKEIEDNLAELKYFIATECTDGISDLDVLKARFMNDQFKSRIHIMKDVRDLTKLSLTEVKNIIEGWEKEKNEREEYQPEGKSKLKTFLERAYPAEDGEGPIWKTKEGKKIPLNKMEDDHLLNAHRFVRRKLKEIQEEEALRLCSIPEEISEYDIQDMFNESVFLGDEKYVYNFWKKQLRKEIKKRELEPLPL